MGTRQRIPGLGERVRVAYAAAGMNRHQAAQALEVAYSTIIKWENEESVPDTANVMPLAALGGIRVEWLLTGQGPMHIDASRNEDVDDAERERLKKQREVVDQYLASTLADGIGQEVKNLLRAFDFRSIGVHTPTVRDVHSLRDLIELQTSIRQVLRDARRSHDDDEP